MPAPRKIIHVDMDAFYAAIEQRDHPYYRGKPLIVGGAPDKRGVVATASYEARAFGVRSAMPSARAVRLCPEVIIVRPRFEVYRQVSKHIQTILQEYTDLVEPLSLDEAYLDVSAVERFRNSATLIAQDIRANIRRATGLTASAGVSYNKFLAKLASEVNKPDGLFAIPPAAGPDFVARLPIGKFHGVGKATEAKMKTLGIHTGADLRAWPLQDLLRAFGKLGQHFHQIAHAIDDRAVTNERVRKSVSSETTFERDLDDRAAMLHSLSELAAEVAAFLGARRIHGHTVTLKVRYANFQLITRSHTSERPLATLADLQALLPALLARTEAGARKVRLLGVGVSNLVETRPDHAQAVQMELF
ncbi:MAG: DNA polymerase IV [Gammaproteobacteria bacterium]